MFCPKCGKEVPDDTLFCPSCGTGISRPSPSEGNSQKNTAEKTSYNVLAIIGLVVSAIAVCVDADTGLVLGIGGLVVSIIGLIQCKKKIMKGTVLSIIGIVLGAIATLYPFM